MTTRICGAWLGFPWISSILGDFMWISWIPRGSGAPGLLFYDDDDDDDDDDNDDDVDDDDDDDGDEDDDFS